MSFRTGIAQPSIGAFKAARTVGAFKQCDCDFGMILLNICACKYIKGLNQVAQHCWFNIIVFAHDSLFLFSEAEISNMLNQQY